MTQNPAVIKEEINLTTSKENKNFCMANTMNKVKKKIHKQGENSCNIYHRKMDTVPIIIMDIKIGG